MGILSNLFCSKKKSKEEIKSVLQDITCKPMIYEALSKLKYKKICEVGIRVGANFKNLMKMNPNLAVAVDSWREIGDKPENNDVDFSQEDLDSQYKEFKAQWGKHKNVKIVRNLSIEAAKQFDDEYFDYIYIDAAHTYEEVKNDLIAWYPKVKTGGILAGHDYLADERVWRGTICGVKKAADEFAKENNLSIDHVIDKNNTGPKKWTDDEPFDTEYFPSFFIIKQN